MSWRILITARTLDVVGKQAVALLRDAGCDLAIKPGPHRSDALVSLLEGQDAVFATTDSYTAAVLDSPHAAKLKMISRWGVGYDAIDVNVATSRGIVVCNTPGVLDEAVADFTFTMLLGIARRIHVGHENLRRGVWSGAWGHDVHGKTLGIVGCGQIGQAVARRAKGFDLELLGYDIAPSAAAAKLGITFVPLDELLARSDFVSLHAALTPESRCLMGASQLRRMKPTAYLINAGRGALIDEAALCEALHGGTIAGAALDTFATEPLPPTHPLRDCPNALLTPHFASFARETGEAVSNFAAQAIVDLMRGTKPRFVVNPSVFGSSALRARVDR
jgi:D-3-phosphoglycerate dehydrogenase / 2-oxoglutarate reductase